MTKKITSGWRTFSIITVSLAVIIFYGAAVTLLGMTIVRPVWIIGVSLVLAAVSAIVFLKKWETLTLTANVVVNILCHIVAATGLFMAVILGVNYFGRHSSDTDTVRAEVVKVYSETHYRSKRVARNRYIRGEPYQVYYMDVRLPDGKVRQRSISLNCYNRYARTSHLHRERADSVDLMMTPGALGMTIIERDSNK